MSIELSKYHGLGNDYLVFDPQKITIELNPKQIKLICDPHFGVGSDGILYGPIFKDNNIWLRIFNPDGSEAEKSGNGIRIFSKYLKDAGYVTSQSFILNTAGGAVGAEYLDANGDVLKVMMGKTTYRSKDIPVTGEDRQVIDETMIFNGQAYQVTCLSIGNPHCVIPMDKINKDIACKLGYYVENSANFPHRINMQLLKVVDRHNIEIQIYERGAGYTLASGSSSCAAASAAYKLGLVDNHITVHMPGGTLQIDIQADESVAMTGRVSSIGTMVLSQRFIDELFELK